MPGSVVRSWVEGDRSTCPAGRDGDGGDGEPTAIAANAGSQRRRPRLLRPLGPLGPGVTASPGTGASWSSVLGPVDRTGTTSEMVPVVAPARRRRCRDGDQLVEQLREGEGGDPGGLSGWSGRWSGGNGAGVSPRRCIRLVLGPILRAQRSEDPDPVERGHRGGRTSLTRSSRRGEDLLRDEGSRRWWRRTRRAHGYGECGILGDRAELLRIDERSSPPPGPGLARIEQSLHHDDPRSVGGLGREIQKDRARRGLPRVPARGLGGGHRTCHDLDQPAWRRRARRLR